MKKNNMFRIASVLLVAVLLSTCAISGAFAKYYTSGTATDSARVAAFGIDVVATGDAFSQWYEDTKLDSNTAAATVAGAAKVIAPGTEGNLASCAISGTAEVDVTVAVAFAVNLSAEFDNYCPIVFFVGDEAYYVGKTGITTTAKLEEAVSAAVAKSENVEAGTDAGYVSAIRWEWVFDANDPRLQETTDDEGQPVAAELAGLVLSDAQDTELASAAYRAINDDDDDTNGPTISFTLTASVTQID